MSAVQKKSHTIPKPNAIIDGILVTAIAVELAVIVYVLEYELLILLAGLFVAVAVAVVAVKFIAKVGGGFFSRVFLKHLGDPLKKEKTMRKFTDQSWQLAIHSSMALFEYVLMSEETWWQDTKTCMYCIIASRVDIKCLQSHFLLMCSVEY